MAGNKGVRSGRFGKELGPRRSTPTLAMTLVLAMSSGRVDAEPKKPVLVLESHIKERPAALARTLATLDDHLETHGFVARPATILRLAGSDLPRPGILDPDLTPTLIAQHLNEGFALFGNGDCEQGVTTLTKAIDEAHRNPDLVVNDTGNLDLMFNAGVALAVCQQRRQNAGGATEAMQEVIRVFPSRSVSRQAAWGKEGEQLYISATKIVHGMGRGRMSISAGSSDVQIFVEGQLRGMGNASLADLVPGRYHVFVRFHNGVGRQYQVEVTGDDDAFLKINPELDSTLSASDVWVGFQFATETARRDEGRYANEVSHRWTKSGSVAVLASAPDTARAAIDGILYRDGVEIRRARVYTDVADADSADKIAAFLADGTPSPGIEVLKNDTGEARPVATAAEGRSPYLVPGIVVGVGVLAVAGGVVLQLEKGYDLNGVQSKYLYSVPGISLMVAGTLTSAAGVWLWHRAMQRSSSSSTPTAAVTGGGAILGWAGTF